MKFTYILALLLLLFSNQLFALQTNVAPTQVPEPSMLALWAIATIGFIVSRKRK